MTQAMVIEMCLNLADRLDGYIECGADIFDEYSDAEITEALALCDTYLVSMRDHEAADPRRTLAWLQEYRSDLEKEAQKRDEQREEERDMQYGWARSYRQWRSDRADEAYVQRGRY